MTNLKRFTDIYMNPSQEFHNAKDKVILELAHLIVSARDMNPDYILREIFAQYKDDYGILLCADDRFKCVVLADQLWAKCQDYADVPHHKRLTSEERKTISHTLNTAQ